MVSRETEDLKGHVDQKVLQASLGVMAMQDSQGLLVSLELMAKPDNEGLPGSRGFKVSLDLQAYLVCLAWRDLREHLEIRGPKATPE